jgi:hypothetical protein
MIAQCEGIVAIRAVAALLRWRCVDLVYRIALWIIPRTPTTGPSTHHAFLHGPRLGRRIPRSGTPYGHTKRCPGPLLHHHRRLDDGHQRRLGRRLPGSDPERGQRHQPRQERRHDGLLQGRWPLGRHAGLHRRDGRRLRAHRHDPVRPQRPEAGEGHLARAVPGQPGAAGHRGHRGRRDSCRPPPNNTTPY